jgi:hypothetical protein
MENCNKISTPISTVEKLSRSESQSTNENIPYREAVGSLMHLMIATRPDLAFTMSVVSKYLDCFNQTHWKAVKRVLKYLNGTKKNLLILGGIGLV